MGSKMEDRKMMLDFPMRHPVYRSLIATLSRVSEIGGFSIASYYGQQKSTVLFQSSTNYFQYTKQKFNKNNIYVLHPPLVALDPWEALVRGVPMILISEYLESGTYKDLIVAMLLSKFKNKPAIVHTKAAQRFLERCGFREIFLIPPAERKRVGRKRREHILFVGKLIGTKNISLLIKISKRFRNEKVVIIGKGPLAEKLAEETKDLPNVIHIPFVEKPEELFDYYSKAKLLIHPAIKDPVGFVVIEALSTQTPVLASVKAGASCYLPKEWTANPNKEDEWFSKIKKMLEQQKNNIRRAEEIFEKEHLNSSNPFFENRARDIYGALCSRWPHLSKSTGDK